jgi:hypothetical protein
MQRLQVGLTGLIAMILIIGLANAIGGQADIAEEAAVPDAAPTTEPTIAPPQSDPLADAGVVPDRATQPEEAPSPAPEDKDTPGAPAYGEGTVTVPDTPPGRPLGRDRRP